MADASSISSPVSDQWSRRATALARVISDIFSPAMMAVPCLLLAVWVSDLPGTYLYAVLYFAVAVPPPVVYVLWLLKTGRISDFHLPDRRDRTGPFAVSIASAAFAVGLLLWLRAPLAFMAPVATALSQTVLLFVVSLVWQISVHTAITAGLVTFAMLALGSGASVLLPFVPLVGWSRIQLGRHTMAQTAAGAVLGCICFTTLYALRGVIW